MMIRKYAILFIMTFLLICKGVYANSCDETHDTLMKQYESATDLYSTAARIEEATLKLKNIAAKLSTSLEECPNHVALNVLMAYIKISLFDNSEAVNFAKKAVEIDSSDWDANHVLGTALHLTGDRENGLSYLEKSLKLNPDNIILLVNLCSTYKDSGMYEKAIDACSKVIAKNETEQLGPAYYIRGRAYKHLNMYKKSQADFEQAKRFGFEGKKYYDDITTNSIKIKSINPELSEPLYVGETVNLEVLVEYAVVNPPATIALNIQKGEMVGMNTNNIIASKIEVVDEKKGEIELSQSFQIPETSSIQIFITIILKGQTSSTIVDMRSYKVLKK